MSQKCFELMCLQITDAALAVLGKLDSGRLYTKPRRTLSAAARKRISAAQKARWAKRASSAGATSTARPKRRMSAAARRRIAAAQRARWARLRAEKK